MNDAADIPAPYKVVDSGVVRATLQEFFARAEAVSQKDTLLAALKNLERRLGVYPQFGEPERDLSHEAGQLYNGAVPPVVVRYAVFEARRLAFVGSPPKLLPNAGF